MAWRNTNILSSGTNRGLSGLHPRYVWSIENGVYHARSCTAGYPDYTGSIARTIFNQALAHDGGTHFIKAGAYTLTGGLVDGGASNVRLEFEQGAVFTAAAATNMPMIQVANENYWDIINPQLQGNSANQTLGVGATGIGVQLSYAEHCHVYGGQINDNSQFGVHILNSSIGCGVQDCTLVDNQWNNITLGTLDPPSYNNYAVNNWCHGGGDVSITTYQEHSRIIGNYIEHVDGIHGSSGSIFGIAMEGGGYSVISNNIVDTAEHGIVLISGTQNIVSNNITRNLDHSGLDIQTDHNVIASNQVFNYDLSASWKYGIELTGANNVCSSNYIEDASATCMGIHGAGNNNCINNNFIICGGGFQVNPSGTGCRVYNNYGYNPKGVIATPWVNGAGYLSDAAAALNNPVTHALYTVSDSPKLIILTNCGGISAVAIDGTAVAGVTTHDPQMYKLVPGQTFHVEWATTTPNGQVFAE